MSEDDLVTQKNRCARARDQAGLSVGQAAKLLGIARVELIAIEGTELAFWHADLRKALHAKIADLYGVDVEWLRGRTPLRDYAAIDRISGARKKLLFRDRDELAEFFASLPRKEQERP